MASASAPSIARVMPPRSGAVRSAASALMPKPTISPRICAPRARARSSGSSTSIAAPSPRISPLRSMENGRQASGAITRIASQPRSVPNVMQASAPPVTAQSTCARAHHLEGKADRMRRRGAGARHHESRAAQSAMHGDLARRRVHHQLRNGQRKHPRLLFPIDAAETVVMRGLAADAGADDAGGAHRQRHVEGEPGLRDRLARRHHRELRDAVERRDLRAPRNA